MRTIDFTQQGPLIYTDLKKEIDGWGRLRKEAENLKTFQDLKNLIEEVGLITFEMCKNGMSFQGILQIYIDNSCLSYILFNKERKKFFYVSL